MALSRHGRDEAEANEIGGAQFVAQGTLDPDVIESVSFTGGPSVTIESHHNVGSLPARMNMKLVEPLRELFKDKVRDLDLLREVDAVYLDEIRKAGLYDKIWQAFAVLLPALIVGVMGDGRIYDPARALHEHAAGDDRVGVEGDTTAQGGTLWRSVFRRKRAKDTDRCHQLSCTGPVRQILEPSNRHAEKNITECTAANFRDYAGEDDTTPREIDDLPP